jgi:hypothetical protein
MQPAEKFIRSCAHKICTLAARSDCCGNLSQESSKNLSYWVTIRMGMSGSASFKRATKAWVAFATAAAPPDVPVQQSVGRNVRVEQENQSLDLKYAV